ncbi:DUF6517 family protein [Haloglomus halophilum]|uniref:DUF6517 family protein n=1 Tax=Haloglomus halophilum TaxID=2962672 RepID=UPI0020C9B533|nr:DUF6517 family protein [Haloglomus halophilum]
MTRRAVAALLALLTITAGCSALTGATTFTAERGTVSESAQSSTDYSLANEDTQEVTRSFAGQEVKVNNQLTEYSRSTSLPVFGDQEVARFSVFTTPAVEVAGQGPFNPVADLNNTQLALQLQAQYDTIDNVRFEGNRTATMLGDEVTVSKFRADAQTTQGTDTEVFMHIAQTRSGDDYVVAIAVYPTQLDSEQENVDTLLNGVQHPGGGGSGGGSGDGGNSGDSPDSTPTATDGSGSGGATATPTDDGLV